MSASYSLIGLKCILFGVVFWGADWEKKKSNSVIVLILKIDKCFFEIMNQSLQNK